MYRLKYVFLVEVRRQCVNISLVYNVTLEWATWTDRTRDDVNVKCGYIIVILKKRICRNRKQAITLALYGKARPRRDVVESVIQALRSMCSIRN